MYKIISTIIVLIVLGFFIRGFFTPAQKNLNQTISPAPLTTTPGTKIYPVDKAKERITKKPFGIHVTPTNSPVQPEVFTGYHTGTDFEILPVEENEKINVYAICDGKILQKRTVTGYGGLLVQSCTINDQAVTVVYGHLSLSSIDKDVGDDLKTSEQFARLGQSPSETSGERKHLHLGIHKGTTADIRGYVQSQPELSSWLDFEKL